MKFWQLGFLFVFVLSACSGQAPVVSQPTDTIEPPTATLIPTDTPLPSETPLPTDTPTPRPTITPTPTITNTPRPTSTPRGGGTGDLLIMMNLSLLKISPDDEFGPSVEMRGDSMMYRLQIKELSSAFNDTVAPNGNMVALWNCNTQNCDSPRGTLYLFTKNFGQIASIDVKGWAYFVGWSADVDRLLYYVGSAVSDEYFLIKAANPGFGEVISLGRMTDVKWSYDHQSLYAQKGDTVYHLDKDGKEIETWSCNFSNDCMHAQSPDGKRFAAIEKQVSSGGASPLVMITNLDFSEKTVFNVSNKNVIVFQVEWLPDNRHLLVYGVSSKQFNRRFLRLDYLGVLDTETGEERVITLPVPEDAEGFVPCGASPDGAYLIYLSTGGRVKQGGRLYMSGRFNYIFPMADNTPTLERLTPDDLDQAWESCAVWQMP